MPVEKGTRRQVNINSKNLYRKISALIQLASCFKKKYPDTDFFIYVPGCLLKTFWLIPGSTSTLPQTQPHSCLHLRPRHLGPCNPDRRSRRDLRVAITTTTTRLIPHTLHLRHRRQRL